jgi:hypothetical protein
VVNKFIETSPVDAVLSFELMAGEAGTDRGLLTIKLQSGMTIALPISSAIATQICTALEPIQASSPTEGADCAMN